MIGSSLNNLTEEKREEKNGEIQSTVGIEEFFSKTSLYVTPCLLHSEQKVDYKVRHTESTFGLLFIVICVTMPNLKGLEPL